MCIFCQSASDFLLRHGVPVGASAQLGDTDRLAASFTNGDYLPVAASAPSAGIPSGSESEIAYVCGVTDDAKVAAISYGTWGVKNDGTVVHDNPATYGNQSLAYKWGSTTLAAGGTAGGNVTYWFDTNSNWTADEQAAFLSGLHLWSALANISFSASGTEADADYRIIRSNSGGATTGNNVYTGTVGSGTSGSPAAHTTSTSIDTGVGGFGPIGDPGDASSFNQDGGYEFNTIVHEEGHMLGLGHGGAYNQGDGLGSLLARQFSVYDSRLWTIMSYIDPDDSGAAFFNSYPVSHTDLIATNGTRYFATTPMMLDILAAQRVYGGPSGGPLTGDNHIFGFHSNIDGDVGNYFNFDINQHPVVTLWATGSHNTLDLSGFTTPSTIGLVAGTFSSCDGMVNNIAIATDVQINDAIGGSGSDNIFGNSAGNHLIGNGGADTMKGGGAADTLEGGLGNDVLSGDASDDTLKGGGGADTLDGGDNTDLASYFDSPAGVTVNLSTGAASGGDAQGDTFNSIENILGSLYADELTGDANPNTLSGSDGNDRLIGSGRNDTMAGGAGDDTYFLDGSGYTITEGGNLGTDTVIVTSNGLLALALAANVENLTFANTVDTFGYGNTLNNVLRGNAANNRLDGDAGDDTVNGGLGDDILSGGANFDFVDYSDAPGGVTVDLGPTTPQNTGSAGTDTLDGFEGIIGSAYNDILLRGFAASVWLRGNDGGDVFHDHNFGNDIFDGGQGIDTVDYSTGGTDWVIVDLAGSLLGGLATSVGGSTNTLISIENAVGSGGGDQLYGVNGQINRLEGRGGDDLLDGRGGADTMIGGLGNDSYFIDNAGDLMVENANEGSDTVLIASHYTLGDNFENLTLLGSADLQGYGNAVANIITGNSGSNLLNGNGGADTMIGGAGSDVYFLDNSGDGVFENANEGNDSEFATVSTTLAANVESLILQGSADLQGYGNAIANVLYGNSGNNLLDGAGGVDLMVGGTGNDVYFADNSSDSCFESAGQGNDAVFSTASYGLAADVESLILQGSADLQGYGNNTANTIYGNTGSNLLNGGGGIDLMAGGAGNDVYFADNASDSCFESAGQGNDAVFSTANYGLAADVESLILQGSADLQGYGNGTANTIYGNAGNNLINGGAAADLMVGGAGGDVYFVDNVGDGILENANEGNDALFASVSYALSANVEGLVLQGAGNLDGFGNAIANSIAGNAGNNTLDGGGGADQLTGNSGNDTFRFTAGQANGDVVVDFAGNGSAAGDALQFIGYGVGANFTNIDATHWQVNYNGGASHDIITFSNGAPIDPQDFSFL